METTIDLQVRADLANETVRHYGEVPQDFPERMAGRIKRKFHADLDIAAVSTLVNNFRGIYEFGSLILKDFILPLDGKHAIPADIQTDHFVSSLIAQYPDEDKAILETISRWVVYYEYLR